MRAGIISLLEREPEIQIVASVGSAEDALDVLGTAAPDVVVLDYRLRGMRGAMACREILGRRPEMSVLVLSSSDEDVIVHACLSAGARGYLLKNAQGPDLVHAVLAVARGGSVVAPEIIGKVIRWACQVKTISAEDDSLATREVVALSLAARGLTNSDIARKIGMSEGSVKLSLRSAIRKLGATERSEAVAVGIRKGLI